MRSCLLQLIYILIQQVFMQKLEQLKPYRSGKVRFLLLFLVSMVVFGNQYAFNNPQALQQSLENDLGIGQSQFQLFYTIFAFPNIFATFIIGFLIDFLGVRIGLIALAAGVVIFQLIIAIGGYAYSYATILIGRCLFGLASQSLITAQASMVSFWFKGKQLAFALGIAITFPELGNALNSFITPIIYQQTLSLGTPMMVSVCICTVSLLCALFAAYLDKKADNEDLANRVRVIQEGTESGQTQSQQIKCEDLKKLKWPFWLIVTLCTFAVGLYVPFLDNANRMYQKRFCFSQTSSGVALTVTYIVAAVFSAPLGLLIDKFGYKRYFIMTSLAISTLAQLIILLIPQCINGLQVNGAIAGLFFIGLGYCFYGNCILPAIPLVVKKKVTGTAFGIMQMIESIALAFFPLITGAIVENSSSVEIGYRYSELFFVLIGVVGIIVSMGLFFVPDKIKKKLDRISKDKLVIQRIEGETIYSASDTDQTSPQQGQIEITEQRRTTDNLKTSLLGQNEKKQVNYDHLL